MSDIPPQSRFDRLVAWLRSLPGRGQRAWRYGSAYYHGGTAQRIITYIIFLTLLAIFLAFFAGGAIGWLVEIIDKISDTPTPPPVLEPPTPTPGPTPIPVPLSYRLPAPVVETVSKFTETDVLRHYLAVGISIWVSVRIAALYFGDLHRIHRFRAASRLFRHMLFAWPFGRLDLAQGEMQTPQPNAQRLLGLLARGGARICAHCRGYLRSGGGHLCRAVRNRHDAQPAGQFAARFRACAALWTCATIRLHWMWMGIPAMGWR